MGCGTKVQVDGEWTYTNPGTCELCNVTSCADGKYLSPRCDGGLIDDAACVSCGTCDAESFKADCGTDLFPGFSGTCTTCSACGAGLTQVPDCSNGNLTEDAECVPCEACTPGKIVAGCGDGGSCDCNDAVCEACSTCDVGEFRSGCECSGQLSNFSCSSGTCQSCTNCPVRLLYAPSLPPLLRC